MLRGKCKINKKRYYICGVIQTHIDMNEYWIDGGETCHQETKEDFYKAINAGFVGFVIYPSGKVFWINRG